MHDVTARLRMSQSPDAVDRERYMAANLYGDAIREHNDKPITTEQMTRFAKQSIAAACLFWEEWDIAVLMPNILIKDDEAPIQGLA